MSRLRRLGSEFAAGWLSFVRRRTAVFFTFLFPVLLVLIFGVLVRTGGGGLFARPAGYYVPGYLAVVVLFTPLTRVGSEVARHREGNRFEKLATTPLTRAEWLLAGTLVNVLVVGLAALGVLVLVVVLTDARVAAGPLLVLLGPFVTLATVLFCGLGAVLGRVADSRDGVVAASNALALPLLFLSDTFVAPALLPAWFRPALWLSPLTYFARGARLVTYPDAPAPVLGLSGFLLVLAVLAVLTFLAGTRAIPRTE